METYRVSQKKLDGVFAYYLSNQVSDFQIVFFSWKLRSIRKFCTQYHFCAILGGQDIHKTKCGFKATVRQHEYELISLKIPDIAQKCLSIQHERMDLSFQEKKMVWKSDIWLLRYKAKTESYFFGDNLYILVQFCVYNRHCISCLSISKIRPVSHSLTKSVIRDGSFEIYLRHILDITRAILKKI